jgi:hypothetical protein
MTGSQSLSQRGGLRHRVHSSRTPRKSRVNGVLEWSIAEAVHDFSQQLWKLSSFLEFAFILSNPAVGWGCGRIRGSSTRGTRLANLPHHRFWLKILLFVFLQLMNLLPSVTHSFPAFSLSFPPSYCFCILSDFIIGRQACNLRFQQIHKPVHSFRCADWCTPHYPIR